MSDLEAEYRLDYFEENGFNRQTCLECGTSFWIRDPDREICGEPPCGSYTFIDDPGFDDRFDLDEMREEFLSFFEARGHERIDPYPVAANRWRDDVLLTQASIYDFQPLVTSGKTPPPANPLCISQPCIRMQDIDNVGKTGRHTMAFEMMAHHAFNTREDVDPDEYAYYGEVYWKDQTVKYCDEFLESLGADLEDVVYIEDPWVGGGNAGPALEVIYRGVELATLVFMCLEQEDDGEYLLKDGNRYSMMDTYIVDTGYGLERWTWVSQGTATVYEAIYPDMIGFLRENAGISYSDGEESIIHEAAKLAGQMDIDEAGDAVTAREIIADSIGMDTVELQRLMEPLELIYAIADHSRTLAYMLGDGIVPSNVSTGYLARMVIRRTKRLCDMVGIDAPLDELVDMEAERLGYDNRDTIRDIIRVEVEKYLETLDRGGRRVRQLAEGYAETDEQIPTEDLITLYDSHGIQPDMVAEIAEDVGTSVDIPDDFYGLVAERHDIAQAESVVEGSAIDDRIDDLPTTEKLFYDEPERIEFEAVILDVFERDDGYDVVLDQTMFYPEGGGQPADRGMLSTAEKTVDVRHVMETDGVVLHRTASNPGKGEFVKGKIDVLRRRQLMRQHTATHIIGHAARKVLGDHIRQAGAQKGTEKSRLDIRHYRRVEQEDIKDIEAIANDIVMANVPVRQEWPDRHDAESAYGFDIYQGGIPPGEAIRIIQVGDDVQACGGTHVVRTGDIGLIKILGNERIQDGVERMTFAAGTAALTSVQGTEDLLVETAEILDVTPEEVPETAARFFTEWKERGKTIRDLKTELAALRTDQAEEIQLGETTVSIQRLDRDVEDLRATANQLVSEGTVAVLGSGADDAVFVVGVPDTVNINAGTVVHQLAEIVGGGGGGPPDFAQGGGPNTDALDEALESAPDILKQVLNA